MGKYNIYNIQTLITALNTIIRNIIIMPVSCGLYCPCTILVMVVDYYCSSGKALIAGKLFLFILFLINTPITNQLKRLSLIIILFLNGTTAVFTAARRLDALVRNHPLDQKIYARADPVSALEVVLEVILRVPPK